MDNEFYQDCVELVAKQWWTTVELEAFFAKWRDLSGRPIPVAVAAVEERTGGQVEETYNQILSDLAKDKLGKRAVEVLRDSADGSIKRQTGAESLGRAIGRL